MGKQEPRPLLGFDEGEGPQELRSIHRDEPVLHAQCAGDGFEIRLGARGIKLDLHLHEPVLLAAPGHPDVVEEHLCDDAILGAERPRAPCLYQVKQGHEELLTHQAEHAIPRRSFRPLVGLQRGLGQLDLELLSTEHSAPTHRQALDRHENAPVARIPGDGT